MAITKITTPELFDFSATNTALQLPTGTTLQRPTNAIAGEWRYNTDEKYVEFYDGTTPYDAAKWFQIDTEAAANADAFPSENFNVSTYFGNGATQTLDAKFNEAANFNGSSSLIQTGFTVPAISAYALSLWFKSTSTSRQYLFSDYNSSGSDATTRLTLSINSGNFVFVLGNGSSGWLDSSVSASSYLDGNWHNLVLAINGTSVKLYADGNTTPIADLTSTVSAGTAGTEPIEIGGSGFGSYFFNGSIDQVRIYDSALSAANVTSLYNEIECPAVAVTNAFNTVLYTGNGASAKSITSLNFAPDLVWIKQRTDSGTQNLLQDTVRGIGSLGGANIIYSDSAETESTNADSSYFASFNSNGFTVGSNAIYNNSGKDYVAWNWKAAATTTTIAANTVGNTIASDVRASTESGFSIVTYTGNTTAGATFGHGLDNSPELIFFKRRNASNNWLALQTIEGVGGYLDLSLAFSTGNYNTWLNNTNPTDTLVTLNNYSYINGGDMLAYCFHSVPGYSKVGSYTWSNTSYTAGTMVAYLGFTPRFVMIKRINGAGNWQMYDSSRGATSGTQQRYALYADNSDQENTSGYQGIGFDSNGFSAIVGADGNTTSGGGLNENGGQYLYLAIA